MAAIEYNDRGSETFRKCVEIEMAKICVQSNHTQTHPRIRIFDTHTHTIRKYIY